MAARGKTGERTQLAQFINNKWETNELHAYFWDVAEFNGCKQIEITGNELVAPVGQEQLAGKAGAFQIFARTTQSNRPWSLYYKSNSVSLLKIGLKIVSNSTYQAPDEDSDNFLIDLSEPLTNTTYAASFLYKKEDGSTPSELKWQQGDRAVDNLDQYPNAPSVVNPLGYSVVT